MDSYIFILYFGVFLVFKKILMFIFERERERERELAGEGQRERHIQNPK